MTREELLNRISVDPSVCFGTPCIRGHRIWVAVILDLLASGMTTGEILESYPQLEDGDVLACVAFGAELARERSFESPVASGEEHSGGPATVTVAEASISDDAPGPTHRRLPHQAPPRDPARSPPRCGSGGPRPRGGLVDDAREEEDDDDAQPLALESSGVALAAGGARSDPSRRPGGDILVDLAAVRARSAARWGTADICDEAELVNLPKLKTLESVIRDKVGPREVDASDYQAFVDLRGGDASAILVALARSRMFKDAFDRAAERVREDDGHQLDSEITLALFLLARGNLLFDDDDELLICAPVGPPLAGEMLRRVVQRIRELTPLAHQVIFELRGIAMGLARARREQGGEP